METLGQCEEEWNKLKIRTKLKLLTIFDGKSFCDLTEGVKRNKNNAKGDSV